MTIPTSSPPNAPGSDWVPWLRAELAFVPHLALTIEDQLAGLAEMCRSRLAADQPAAAVVVGHTRFEAAVSVRFDSDIVFDIDVTKGEFCLWEVDDESDESDESDWAAAYRDADLISSSPPEQFVEHWDGDDVMPAAEGRALAARTLAFSLWRALSRERDLAIRTGSVIVWARVGSPFAAFTMIAPDQWAHLRIVDRTNGVAEAPTGERAYSIQLAPSGKIPGPENEGRDDAEAEATAWLADRLRNLPEGSKTKNEFMSEMNRLWPGMGGPRPFNRCWKAATEGRPGWKAGGRRSKLPNQDTKTRH